MSSLYRQSRLWITSPYFVPDNVMVYALQAAAMRGVDIRILLPGKADHRLVELPHSPVNRIITSQ